MQCVECGGALESILERMRKVCSVCYFGHRFRVEHRPADLLIGRPRDDGDDRESGARGCGRQGEEGPRPATWSDLGGRDDRNPDAGSMIPHIPGSDPADQPAMVERVEEPTERVLGRDERREIGEPATAPLTARARAARATARLAHERTAALLARLESTWGIGLRAGSWGARRSAPPGVHRSIGRDGSPPESPDLSAPLAVKLSMAEGGMTPTRA